LWGSQGEGDGDLKAAYGSILRADGAIVEADGFAGDRKAEACSAGAGLAAWGGAEEGREDVGEHGFGDSGAGVEDVDGDGAGDGVGLAVDVDGGAGRRVADGVAQNVVDGTAEEVGIGEEGDLFAGADDVAVSVCGLEVRVVDDAVAERVEGDGGEGLGRDAACFEAGEEKELLDEVTELVGLAFDADEGAAWPFCEVSAQEGEGEMHAGEGRAELVGDVGDEAALGGHEELDLRGHGVEVVGERAELVATTKVQWARAGVEFPCGEAARGGLQPGDGAREVEREGEGDESGGDHGDEQVEQETKIDEATCGAGDGEHGDVAAAGGALQRRGIEDMEAEAKELGVAALCNVAGHAGVEGGVHVGRDQRVCLIVEEFERVVVEHRHDEELGVEGGFSLLLVNVDCGGQGEECGVGVEAPFAIAGEGDGDKFTDAEHEGDHKDDAGPEAEEDAGEELHEGCSRAVG